MGRIGETISRTWKTCHKMKQQRGEGSIYTLVDGRVRVVGNDNERALRYVSKYTINPAVAHGVSHIVGSAEPGKWADLIVYKFENFGTRPSVILKGGYIAYAAMGDANASIPTTQPVIMEKMWGAYGGAVGEGSIMFCSTVGEDLVKVCHFF